MMTYIYIVSFFVIFILFIYGMVNYNLKNALDHYINNNSNKEGFSNYLEILPEDNKSIRPIDDCTREDIKTKNFVYSPSSGGIPENPWKYNYYVQDVYKKDATNPIGKTNGKYCVSKPKLLFDGIWSPYVFTKDGFEHTKWSLTNGNLSEGEVCMKSLYDNLKTMPKDLPPDCPVKCLTECDMGVYCNGPVMNDPQDLTSKIDEQYICFPSVFSPNGNKNPLPTYGF